MKSRVAILLLVTLLGCASEEAGPGRRPLAEVSDEGPDPGVAVERKLRGSGVSHAFANVTLTRLFEEVAGTQGLEVHGLGTWSDAVTIPSCGAPGWSAYQVLHDASNRCGKFGWNIEDDGVRVYPATTGDPLPLYGGTLVV